jgi:hypothetical protein
MISDSVTARVSEIINGSGEEDAWRLTKNVDEIAESLLQRHFWEDFRLAACSDLDVSDEVLHFTAKMVASAMLKQSKYEQKK